jgi:hypothetical protein
MKNRFTVSRKAATNNMKKMLIIMLWSVGWSGHFSAAQSKCAALTGGQVSGHVYTNKDLGLSYTFPESLKAESQDKLPKNKNSRLLLVLWKEPRDLGKPSIIILADDLSQYPDPTVTGYLRTIVNMAKRYNPPATVLEVGRQYDLSGIKFYRVDYEFPSPTPAYNVAITSQIQNCEISFDFTGRTKQEVETFVQSIDTVRFARPKR